MASRKQYKLGIFFLLVFILGAIILIAIWSHTHQRTVSLGSAKIQVEIATTLPQQQHGLCCRDSLPKNSGMLFIYDQPQQLEFWMKDTRIPLDMYWLDSTKKVILIEKNVQPNSYPKNFGPTQPAQFVLETNAGYADQHHIQVGDVAHFQYIN